MKMINVSADSKYVKPLLFVLSHAAVTKSINCILYYEWSSLNCNMYSSLTHNWDIAYWMAHSYVCINNETNIRGRIIAMYV